jgi:hypothetical protein
MGYYIYVLLSIYDKNLYFKFYFNINIHKIRVYWS